MHLNFDWNAVQIIWTLTFAALLVLLVVLLGRDRARRYPFFTVSIVLATLDMLGKRLLHGRMPQFTLAEIFITLADIVALVGLLVVVEMARNAFAGMRRLTWIVGTVVLLAVGVGVLYIWGPWPAWKMISVSTKLAVLELMQLVAQKSELLVSVLTVQLGLLVILFGRRFKAGWRSHTQQIVIGLSTTAFAHLAFLGIWQLIATKAVPQSQAEFDRVLGIRDKLTNANGSVYLAVLLWWIVCLWIDEPGTVVAVEAPAEIAADAGIPVDEKIAEEPAGTHEKPADALEEEEQNENLSSSE